jgi:heterodisulfide reductase subunit B2
MKYGYFPGCSAEATGKAYDISTRALVAKLGIDMPELDDWNCCGATSYFSTRELMSFAINARNLSLAEQAGCTDVVAACNSCFTGLAKTNDYLQKSPHLAEEVNEVLAQVGRTYSGNVKVRHIADVLVNDYGLEAIAEKVTRRLTGLKVAIYYGCQFSRPMGAGFDDFEFPVILDKLFAAMGATVVDFPMKTKCCGGMMMMIDAEPATKMCYELLRNAAEAEPDVIVCACPLCEMNMEAYQSKVNARYGTSFKIPVMYFTQLAGYALGCTPRELALQKQLIPVDSVLAAVPA